MERVEIRGRLLHLLEREGWAEERLWNGSRAYAVGPEELSHLLEVEFGVRLAPDEVPELLTVTWLTELVARQRSGDSLVM